MARPRTSSDRLARSFLATCILAVLVPGSALAEVAADATDLDTIQVTAQRAEGYGLERTSTATRLTLSPRETPQTVSAIGREQMDDFALTNVNDVLNAVTGVSVESVETSRTYYTARGFDITNMQRDGLGVPMQYGIQDGDLDTAIYERIEVLKGANGLMSATGTPSATVNFIRKRPTADLRGQARLTLGRWSNRRIDIDVSGPLTGSGNVRGRAVAAWDKGDSHLDRYSLEKQIYYGVVEADLGPSTRLTGGASYQRNNPNGPLWGALPLYYSDGTPTDYDVSTSTTAADWTYWDSEDTRAFIELDHSIGNWNLRASFNHQKTETDSQLLYVFGNPDPETGAGLLAYPGKHDGRFSACHADVYATGPIVLGGREHDVVFGGNWASGGNRKHSRYAAYPNIWAEDPATAPPLRYTPLDVADLDRWDGRFEKPLFNGETGNADYDYRSRSLYATVRWNLADTLKLITGASRSHAKTAGMSYGTSTDADETRTTPFAGVVWDPGRHYSAYASYGEIFNPQAELDENGRLLGAVIGSNAELGLKGEWMDGRLNGSLAVFRARQENLADYAGFNPGTGDSYYRGIEAESHGFELDVAGRIGDNWQIAAGFTRLEVENAAGDPVRTYVPRESLRLSAVWNLPWLDGLRAGARLNWQNEIYRDEVLGDGTPVRIEQDAYALLGLMLHYDFAPQWSATLNLDNITGEKYISSLYWEQGAYGAPRNASLTLAYRF